MSKLKEIIKSGHVHIAAAAGISIIVMAYVSKHVLPEPIGYLYLAIPPFIATIYESLLSKEKYARYCRTPYWEAAIFIATIIVIWASAN